jgi:hypothetical protein
MRSKDQLILEKLYTNVIQSNPYNLVMEVDWSKFKDVDKVCYTPESVADALNAEIERLKIPTKDRPKASLKFPRISKGNIPLDEQGKANVENFKKQLMQRPKTIFDKGEKSLHTTDQDKMTINTGIPALRAVIYDEKNDEFFVINTCPGAADCIKNCYAMQGFYIMNDGKNLKLLNRLQLMMNDPEMYEKLAFMEAERYAFEAQQEEKELKIRWNDAGDFFSDVYFEIAKNVDKALKKKGYNSSSYLYTKVGKYIKLGEEEGMKTVFSSGATQKEKNVVGDLSKTHTQITVPVGVTQEFFVSKGGKRFAKDESGKTKFANDQAKEGLRKKIVDYYNTTTDPKFTFLNNKLDIKIMKFTDELPAKEGSELEFDTITLPGGDSDVPAQRKDVRFTFLTEH